MNAEKKTTSILNGILPEQLEIGGSIVSSPQNRALNSSNDTCESTNGVGGDDGKFKRPRDDANPPACKRAKM